MRKSLTNQCYFVLVFALLVWAGGDVVTLIGSEPAVNAAREKLDGTN